MKLVRMRTLGVFGLGFLAGSRAGHGPWEKAQATMEQLKGKMAGTSMGGAREAVRSGRLADAGEPGQPADDGDLSRALSEVAGGPGRTGVFSRPAPG